MQTALLADSLPVVNVASVPQRSPFRYPGGKTWFVPYLRTWLRSLPRKPVTFVEPFAGGGIASLTAVMEGLVQRAVMAELDSGVACVWKVILGDGAKELVSRIRKFEITREAVIEELCRDPEDEVHLAFQTILRNRVQRGGILAPGASLVKNGENHRGVASRWYPETLAKRILSIAEVRDRIEFLHKDAFDVIPRFARQSSATFFVDPPYTAGGKSAGSRLYVHNHVNHAGLFEMLGAVAGSVMLTYDDAPEVRDFATRHAFLVREIPMKNTHHNRINELALTNRLFDPSTDGDGNYLLLAEKPASDGARKKSKSQRHQKQEQGTD
jgi:DNA adenine methylase